MRDLDPIYNKTYYRGHHELGNGNIYIFCLFEYTSDFSRSYRI